uniref:Uncharacterized protein n=1 Tax=Pyrodinium bahamense TaxID=73915 RepID=A0A7S0FJK2_9DINO|mmetsp:Transcript_34297/g.94716  ORF Transcript_34297/g.94716 Transcript_34297/m.94716 type:complete len:749 (+) Transcript_34297:94-2340(+)
MPSPHPSVLFLPAVAMLLLTNPTSSSLAAVHQQRGVSSLSPVTRVVELLQALSDKIHQEGKAEEDLLLKFQCWAKSIISAKEASNTASRSRITTLDATIADLKAGNIELTSEREDLDKEIEQLAADIKLASDMRAKEESDYLSARDEMQKAIVALTAAIDVLKTATADHKEGVLLTLKGGADASSESHTAEAAVLSHAAELGEKFLTKGDALFLRRLLTGEVPTWDWKKLNRPATFKRSYKARSFKIQEVLAKLLETFATNLREAQEKEAESKITFDKLKGSKETEHATAQQARRTLAKENGARAMSIAEASEEVRRLTAEVSNDETYIAQVKQALKEKLEEWDRRKVLRTGELNAISEAISILHGDESRDLFKESFKSQGYSLLQEEGARGAAAQRRGDAAAALRRAASAAHARGMGALAARLAAGGHFDEVLVAIEAMLTLLRTEESEDLAKKESCESDRAADTRDAALTSRRMDDMTDLVTRLSTEIEEIAADIRDKQQRVKEIDDELEEAKQIRDAEHADYLVAKQEDESARDLVHNAAEVLKNWYTDNGLMLAQRGQKQGPPQVPAGQAPPPPPKTWEAPYGGKTGEAKGIIAVLAMIKEDIEKDIATADTAENKSRQLYETTKAALDGEKEELVGLISKQTNAKGNKEQTVATTKSDRQLQAGSLGAVMMKIENAEPGCDFFTVNFPLRSKNRQIEIDGLEKAKAILSGAQFATPADPLRELKPGDAFVQGQRYPRRHHLHR